ncbi:MAG: hypothetical protein COA58_15640 [Bacteroidetes bacterium]|nr:MAG: hypothetical protein COA58_15640 [Bacteroidota bacterium]
MSKEYGKGNFLSRLDIFIKSGFKSRNEFCAKVGVSLSTVNGYFSRKSNPNYEFIEKFLDVYPPEDLLWLVKGIRKNSTVGEDEVYYGNEDPYSTFQRALQNVIAHEVKKDK